MSILLKKIVHYRKSENYANPYIVTDMLSFNTGNGIDIKNNILRMSFSNYMSKYKTVTLDIDRNMPIGNFINNDTHEFVFQERDMFKVYLKYSDDAGDITSEAWTSPNENPESEYLIGTYFLIEYEYKHSGTRSVVDVVCADKVYILFNRILAKTWDISENFNAPELIQKVIQLTSTKSSDNDGAGFNLDGVFYELDARLVSEGGYIQDTRRDTYEDGTSGASTTFPDVAISFEWKPVYEWLQSLSQVDKINSVDELSGTGGEKIVYGRPFIIWIDENEAVHWVEVNDSIDSDNEIIVGRDNVTKVSIGKKVFDTVNFLVFNCGDDMNGSGILHYQLNDTTNVSHMKMQYQPMTGISEDFKKRDYEITLPASRVNSGLPKYNQYPSSYSVTTAWGESVSNDSEYNSTLRQACKDEGSRVAQQILSKTAMARFKGNVTMIGKRIAVGNKIEFTDTQIGLILEPLRIVDVRHNIGNDGWFTTIQLEEDEVART